MAAFRLKLLGGALLGLLVAVTAVILLTVPLRKAPPPVAEPRPAEAPAAAQPPAPALESSTPAPPVVSRSRGDRDWAFFFRPGDTLSRMTDGTPLGVVVRLERQHRFDDGSTGPAYVVRSAGQAELSLIHI